MICGVGAGEEYAGAEDHSLLPPGQQEEDEGRERETTGERTDPYAIK